MPFDRPVVDWQAELDGLLAAIAGVSGADGRVHGLTHTVEDPTGLVRSVRGLPAVHDRRASPSLTVDVDLEGPAGGTDPVVTEVTVSLVHAGRVWDAVTVAVEIPPAA